MSDTPNDQLFSTLFGASPKSQPPQMQNGASSTTPQSSESAPHLNPRSCVTCRKRKVRCDKHEPCGNCSKAGIDCVFPAPGRAPRKPRKPLDAELLKRLKRLEGVVSSLGAQVDEPSGAVTLDKIPVQSPSESNHDEHVTSSDSLPAIGKLVISNDRSRYVSNAYWAGLENEIEDIRDILDQSSDDDEIDHASPEASPHHDTLHLHGFLFGLSSLSLDMRKLYPSPSQIFIIWEIFKENIDPIIKVLHCPSVKNLILKAAVNTDNLSKQAEALFFSVCFGTVVSMSNEQCESLLGDSKTNLWKKYRYATEQALARANFLNSSSLIVLQAFIFYLICLRYLDDSKSVWALGGLAIHQGYTLGLHRDGTHFGLDPFECEMRRRLWWHINILDIRAAEDHGTDIRTSPTTFDTRMPSNINDDAIWPGMKDPPQAQEGATEMTFCLIRFEMGSITRKLQLFSSPNTQNMSDEEVKAKEEAIDACHKMIEEKYIKHCNMNIPIFWVATTVGRLILAKMWLKLHHPRLVGQGLYKHPDIRERVFLTSIEVVEFGHVLESNEDTARWAWLFQTYMQWHAVAHVLSELTIRGPGPDTDRAWRAIDAVYDENEHTKKQRGMLWKPIRQLYAKATATRQRHNKENGDSSFDTQPFLQGERSGIAASASALGLDFQETSLLPAPVNLGTPEVDKTMGDTPEVMNWEDWESMIAGVQQPVYPFNFNTAQEWF